MMGAKDRLSALRRLAGKRKLDAVLLTCGRHVRYFTGFTGEDSYLLVGRRWARLLTDSRFTEQARVECPRLEAIIRTGPMLDAMKPVLSEQKVRRLGFEANAVTVSLRDRLAGGLGKVRLVPLGGEVEAMRLFKDAGELKAIGKAIRAAEGAFASLLAGGRKALVGRSERQVAAELEYRMRLAGADGASFPTIVAAGAHAAMPHYRAGETVIRAGDAVLIDWGAVVAGYCSDLTRVVFTGKIPTQIGKIYEIVLRAQAAGISALKAGVAGAAADAAARRVIDRAGYGEAFGHGLGHGIGLEVHEGPRLGRRVKDKLSAGMVVTVEPGIYLPGVGGVRIEDDVLVAEGGRRRLTRLPRDLDAMRLA